jgi:hypothetical protein
MEALFLATSRNQGSRGKIARMIKIIFDVKRRYLPTTYPWAGYERGMSVPNTQRPPRVPTHRQFSQPISSAQPHAPRRRTYHPTPSPSPSPWCPHLTPVSVKTKYSPSSREQIHTSPLTLFICYAVGGDVLLCSGPLNVEIKQ